MTSHAVLSFAYPIRLEALDGEVIARAPDFPELLTGGVDREEALHQAEDALGAVVRWRLAEGQTMPLPSPKAVGDETVLLDPLLAARVLVDIKRREAGWTRTRLAEAMGKDEKVVRRILDGRGTVSMETTMTALRALGYRATLAYN